MWDHSNQVAALAEGWGLFDNSDHGLRIERCDGARRFNCDAAAVAFVGLRAAVGNRLARLAFKELAYQHAVSDAALEGKELVL